MGRDRRDVLAEGLGTSLELGQTLLATDTTTPVAGRLGVLVGVVGLDRRDELGELRLVLGADVTEREDRRRLAADNGTETGLALDDGVGDTHLAAQGRKEDDELDRVDVVGNDDQVRLLGLDERDDVVQTRLDKVRLLRLVELLLAGSEVGRTLVQARLLLLLRLALVLLREAEERGRRVLVKNVGELGDRGRRLEALVKDDLLALETDVFRPLDEAGQVGRVTDRLACNTELSSARRPGPRRRIRHAPIPNDLGRASNRGFEVFLPDLAAPGALATFLVGA